MKQKLRILTLLLTGAALSTSVVQAELSTFSLPGTTENYGWTLNDDNYPGLARKDDWSVLSTNQSGDVDIFLKQTGPFEPLAPDFLNDPVGSYILTLDSSEDGLASTGEGLFLTNASPLAGLETIILQLDYRQLAQGFGPGSAFLAPVLKVGGVPVGTDGLADFFLGNDTIEPNANFTLAGFGFTVDAGEYAWQWDVRGLDLSGGYTIEWDSPSNNQPSLAQIALLTDIQLDEGTQFAQVVPEPSTYAALVGAAAIGLVLRRRRPLL